MRIGSATLARNLRAHWRSVFAATVLTCLLAVTATACIPPPWEVPRRLFNLGASFFNFILFLIGLGVYFLPTIIAAVRRARNLLWIILVNVFAGWTFVGWIVALVWSLVDAKH